MKTLFSSFKYLLLIILMFPASAFAQCPMCRAAAESSLKDGTSQAAVGLNDGIIYLLSMPYIALVVIGYIWYRAYRRNRVQ